MPGVRTSQKSTGISISWEGPTQSALRLFKSLLEKIDKSKVTVFELLSLLKSGRFPLPEFCFQSAVFTAASRREGIFLL
jgi:hypothetical protein